MSDQLITVIGSVIIAVSSIIGIVVNSFLTKKQILESEKQKHEIETATKEKERKRALLEELCSLCLQVEREVALTLQVSYTTVPPPVTASEPMNRMAVIVNMYYKSLKSIFDDYVGSLRAAQKIFYNFNE